ncbi:MAG: hypothetical protein IJ982_02245, partial [Fibrobacter sp.]|nr:hypothetical protein [Fibrobacter sp.]
MARTTVKTTGKQPKYIFITGGVVSSLGKGITSASLALLLKSRGYLFLSIVVAVDGTGFADPLQTLNVVSARQHTYIVDLGNAGSEILYCPGQQISPV